MDADKCLLKKKGSLENLQGVLEYFLKENPDFFEKIWTKLISLNAVEDEIFNNFLRNSDRFSVKMNRGNVLIISERECCGETIGKYEMRINPEVEISIKPFEG